LFNQYVTPNPPTAKRRHVGSSNAPHALSDLPQHHFTAILADPPWHFVTRSPKGQGRSASQHYSTMSFEQIASLPVAELAADRAFLILWVPFPHLPLGLQLIERWGFRFSGSGFVWAKRNPSGVGWHMGAGYSTRKNAEVSLLGRRGKSTQALIKSHEISELIEAPRREHNTSESSSSFPAPISNCLRAHSAPVGPHGGTRPTSTKTTSERPQRSKSKRQRQPANEQRQTRKEKRDEPHPPRLLGVPPWHHAQREPRGL
jgi:N6-adenosine-specific RNA methylase IME4